MGGGRGFAHVYPADGLFSVDEVHGHGLLGGDGGQPGRRAAQEVAADVMEVRDKQHGKAVHRFWGERSHGNRWFFGGGNKLKKKARKKRTR